MKLAKNPRALVSGLALIVCALAPFACALEMSGLGSADASATGTGGSTGEPAGAGGATGGAGGGASSVNAASSSDASSVSSVSSVSSASSSGSGPPLDPCGPGSTLEFQDDFDDDMRNAVLWEAYANSSDTIFETGQQVVIIMNESDDRGGYISKPTRSLLGCYVYIEVKQVVNSDDGGAGEVYFRLNDGLGQHLEFRQRGSDIKLTSIIQSGTQSDQISYSTSVHRWWRFRESNGKITWDTSADGQDWQTQRSIDTSAFGSVASLKLEFGATGADQNNNDVHFDNVNVNVGGI